MNCPGLDHCEIFEHKGYSTCQLSGQCQSNPAPPPALEVVRPPVASRRTEPAEGRGAGLLLMLAIALACVLMGD